MRRPKPGPLFTLSDKKPLTLVRFVVKVKEALSEAGVCIQRCLMIDTTAALSHSAFTVLPLQNQPKMAAAIMIGAKLYAPHNVTSKALVRMVGQESHALNQSGDWIMQ